MADDFTQAEIVRSLQRIEDGMARRATAPQWTDLGPVT